jgi:hypothetical protein
MIARTVDAGDNFKKRASIPLAPCIRFLTEQVQSRGEGYASQKDQREDFLGLRQTTIYLID